MKTRKSLLIALVMTAAISSRAHVALAQATQPPVLNDKLAAIFGALAFDSLRQADVRSDTHWFAPDSLTFRLLSPAAKSRGVRLEVSRGAYPTCPWKTPFATDSAARAATAPAGYWLELFTRVDSVGHSIAGARVGCSAVANSSSNARRGRYSTGLAVEIVMKNGVWKVARVVDRWIT